MPLVLSRTWAMPNADTFQVSPIREFVIRWLRGSSLSLDPFARNSALATFANDIDPETSAEYHLDAEAFVALKASQGVKADLVLFDPPYSPDQAARAYRKVRLKKDRGGSHNGELYARVRNALMGILTPQAVVLSFGWNTAGMGKGRGFEPVELLVVCHGGAHNDTLCLAERWVG